MLDYPQEVYSINNKPDNLVLVRWVTPRTDIGASYIPKDTSPQPLVVNGYYELERTKERRVLKFGKIKYYFVCRAPKGKNYNDILNKVRRTIK